MGKATALRRLLAGGRPVLAMGAHDGMGARLAEQAGFDAVWASGFEISASRGLPDANLVAMSENLEAARWMNEAASVPVIADCDNGYGNAVNVKRTVRAYEAAGIAAVCIEDNAFPKRCSFYAGVERGLVSADEHAGKVRAAAEARTDPAFTIIARTEALIAGLGMGEAISRARAYAAAGADAILVHSKSRDGAEILEFGRRWDGSVPLVAVPTTYGVVPASTLFAAGYRVVIFANQGLRAAVRAVGRVLAVLRAAESPAAVEGEIAPLEAIYDLVGVRDLERDEKAYLPEGGAAAVILAAGRDAIGAGIPKCMLSVDGKTILERQVEALRAAGAGRIAVVRGYRGEWVGAEGVRTCDHPGWAESGEAGSLAAAAAEIHGRVVVLYGDILFDPILVQRLLASRAEVAIVADRAIRRDPGKDGHPADRIQDDGGPARLPLGRPASLVRIGDGIRAGEAHGEFVGMLLLSGPGCEAVRALLRDPGVRAGSIPELVARLAASGRRVEVVDTWKGWMDVDTIGDWERACRESHEPAARLRETL